MLPLFQENFILGEVTSSYFFRVTTSTQQLLFRDSYVFRIAAFSPFSEQTLFRRSYLFRTASFFGVKLLQSKHFLKIRSSLRQLLFGKTTLSGRTVQNKFFKVGTSAQHQLFQKATFWKKPIFQRNNIPQYIPFFSGELTFQSGYFFKRRYLLQQLPFQKGYIFKTYFFRRVTISQQQFHSTVTLFTYSLVIK